MSKEDVNFELLDLFDDNEINIVCKNADLTTFLALIKNKRYEKYSKKLGRLDKKSALVQKFLPKIAFDLYKKNEESFRKAIVSILQNYKYKFLQTITEYMEPPIGIEEINEYTYEQIADFYFKFQKVYTSEVPEDLFYIFLKLHGIYYLEQDKSSINGIIKQKRDKQLVEIKHKLEIDEALKQLEQEMTAVHMIEQDELKQQIKEYKTKYEECLLEKNVVQKSLDSLKAQIEYDRREMEAEWQDEYEKQIEKRKIADEDEFRIKREEAENSHQNLLKAMEIALAQQKAKMDEQYQIEVKNLKQKFIKELESLRKQIRKLNDEKKMLSLTVSELNSQKEGIEAEISSLKHIEDSYFATFEKRIIEKKIDSVIFDKLGISESKEKNVLQLPKGFSIITARSFSEATEYGENVEQLEDFVEDCKDNINIHFDNETEITAVVLAALIRGMSIIAIDPVCKYLSESFSALLDMGMPAIVKIDCEKIDFYELSNQINSMDSKVIMIKGVLDLYDEMLFGWICEECSDKYCFFSISNLENVKIMSRTITDMAIVVDAEDYLHFELDENILIGDHDISPLIPKINIKTCHNIMKKVFNRLVSNNLIGKSTALKYCGVLEVYFEIINTNIIGNIMQKAIASICGIDSDMDESVKEILIKSGITFLGE